MTPTESCQLVGTCCQLCLVVAEVVAGLHTLMKFVVAEAEAGTDVLVLVSEVVEALVANVDSYALVLES
jgi:hypothetical protein